MIGRNEMGFQLSKPAVVPYAKISAKMLLKQSNASAKSRSYLLSPQLCSSILRQYKGQFCPKKDVEALKDFLSKSKNVQKSSYLSAVFTSSTKKRKRLSRKWENELVRFIFQPRQVSGARHPKLSATAEKHLTSLLSALEATYYKPVLIDSVIQPKLKEALDLNTAVVRDERNAYIVSVIVRCFKYFMSFFRQRLSAQTLRRDPREVKRVQGLDRAHKLSLHLAVVLWKKVYGHEFVKSQDRKILRDALSQSCNVYYTCAFTNRTLHLKYDHEIADLIQTSQKKSLSPGARARVKQVKSVMNEIQTHSKLMRKFCGKSVHVLNRLL